MAKPRTRAEAFAWCGRMLGDGVVVIELTKTQIEDAWDDAVTWFVANRGIERLAVATVSGTGRYTLPDDVDTVTDVYFPQSLFPNWDFNPGELVGLDYAMSYYQNDVDFSNYYSTMVLWMQRSKVANSLTSQDPQWEWRPEAQLLYVFPSSKSFSGTVMVKYISSEIHDTDPVEQTDQPNDLRRFPVAELDLILKYFVAQAKLRLGRVRSKYADGMPSAGGKALLDGDMLLNEAKDEIQTLTEKLSNYGPVAPVIG